MSARMLPRLDSLNRPFWTGGADGALLITRCTACECYIHPPAPVCWHCLSDEVSPHQVEGTGTIDTFTINHQAWRPDIAVPYVIARVRLDGVPGVILTTNIVNCDPADVAIGDRVRVTFEQHDDVWLPLFEKVG